MFSNMVIVHGGELADDVSARILAKKSENQPINVSMRPGSESPKTLLDLGPDTLVCFVLQTIENASPTEEGGICVRFFQRKSHPNTLLIGKFNYTILGLGDSNLLLDRQTTGAADCNQVAQQLDARLKAVGGQRFYEVGLADERTGLTEVESWIDGLWAALS